MKYILSAIQLMLVSAVLSQTLVEDFNMPIPYTNPDLKIIKVDDNDKILLSGDIDLYEGLAISSLIRLNADGSLDNSFSFHLTNSARAINFLSNGEIIVLAQDSLYRLDNSGVVMKAISNSFSCMAIIQDYIYLASSGSLVKLNSDFESDDSFNGNNEFSGSITAIERQGNDKLLVAGLFDQINGITKNDIARFDLDGNLDMTFDVGSGTDDFIKALVVQPDNKIIIAESFINSFNGTQFDGLARLNEDGGIDFGFLVPPVNSHTGSNVLLQNDKILVTESYFDGSISNFRFLELNSDGSIFNSFNLSSGSSQVAIHPDGDILINSETGNGIKKYSQEGIIADEFNPPLERIGYFNNAAFYEDFIIVTGDFFRLGTVESAQIAKIDFSGAVDEQFKISEEVNAANSPLPVEIKIRSRDEIYISIRTTLLKLNSSGELLEPFIDPLSLIRPYEDIDSNPAHEFEFLSNGKIVMKGPNGTYLLNEDGTQDETFEIRTDINSTAFGLGIQSDDHIIIGSRFNEVNEIETKNIVKVNTEGIVDQEFANNAGTGFSSFIKSVEVLPNDNMIIQMFVSGDFGGMQNNLGLFMLDEEGSLDTDFNTQINTSFETPIRINGGDLHKGESYLFGYPGNGFELGKINYSGQLDTNFSIDEIENISAPYSFIPKPISSGGKFFIVLGTFELGTSTTEALLFIDNDVPLITTSDALFTLEETPLLISIDNLTVEDPDDEFPTEFSLTVLEGDNYTLSENQVLPATDFNGTLTVPVTVNDGLDDSPIFNLSISVTPVNDAPQITTPVNAEATEDVLFTYTASAVDVENDELLYSISNNSEWLSITGSVVSGTPTEGILEGTFDLMVADGNEGSDTQTVTISVTPVNDAPQITAPANAEATEDVLFTYTASAVDAENDELSYSISNHAEWLSITENIVSGTPTEGILEGTFDLIVEDDNEGSATQTVTISVVPVNDAPEITEYLGTTSFPENESLEFKLTDLIVTDSDNEFPSDFSLTVQNGENYVAANNQIVATEGIVGLIDVSMRVNDGELDSKEFIVSIEVTQALGLADEPTEFMVYPNPTSGLLKVVSNQQMKYQLSIFTIDGKLLFFESTDRGLEKPIDLSHLTNGMYLIRIITDDETRLIKLRKE